MNDSELVTKSIKAISRASVKIGDSFYTFEFGMEKEIPKMFNFAKLDEEKTKLWDECNAEVDGQIEQIVEFLKSKRK